jgi:predicted ester cyclase
MTDVGSVRAVVLIERYVRALNERQREQALAIVADELDHNGERMTGAQWWDRHIAANVDAVTGYVWTIDEIVAAGDRVFVRYTDSGTLNRPWVGLTGIGRPIRFREYVFYTVRADRIVEVWSVFDHWALVGQAH